MATPLKLPIYTARASVNGGREGHGRSSDGVLDLHLRLPKEMGGPGIATNPEQLFALGYAASFQSALAVAGRRELVETTDSSVTARVTLGITGDSRYGLAAELKVRLPGVDPDTAMHLVHAAHEVCPYSNAIRGNIEVILRVV
jgi:osmotically inducible protein OsmC